MLLASTLALPESAIRRWPYVLFLLCFAIQLATSRRWLEDVGSLFWVVVVTAIGVIFRSHFFSPLWGRVLLTAVTVLAANELVGVVQKLEEVPEWGFWLCLAGLTFVIWETLGIWARLSWQRQNLTQVVINLWVPLMFGGFLLFYWEVLTVGFKVPFVLLPPPSMVGAAILKSPDILWADFQQTFVKSVLIGYLSGCGAGLLVAVLVDRSPFLQRGLLPLGNLVSALPVVGVAPIMVMWFGFDWQSKAAVVIIMTFFPMLVNTITGLASPSRIENDLMRSYAADYWQTLFRLRLPSALPFIFNALKINSTLALIGAIVAEFFGTPIVGMGFRISTEIGRMNVDLVWASIAVAALAGSMFYAGIALIERRVTSWHPSFHD